MRDDKMCTLRDECMSLMYRFSHDINREAYNDFGQFDNITLP